MSLKIVSMSPCPSPKPNYNKKIFYNFLTFNVKEPLALCSPYSPHSQFWAIHNVQANAIHSDMYIDTFGHDV